MHICLGGRGGDVDILGKFCNLVNYLGLEGIFMSICLYGFMALCGMWNGFSTLCFHSAELF